MTDHEPHNDSSGRPDGAPDQPPIAERNATEAAGTLATVSFDAAPPSRSTEYAATNVSVVREGIRRYGEPFLAYLILDGVEQRSPDLIEQYERRYLGSFADRQSFARWGIPDQGWDEELAALRSLQGMWPDDIVWRLDALWEALATRYVLTERLGGVHAFRR